MTCKEYLAQIRKLKKMIVCHAERLRTMRLEADSVSSRWGERVFSGCTDAPFVRLMERIAALEERVHWENNLYDTLYEQVTTAVESLPDVDSRLVLLYHYVDGKSFSEIGNIMQMSKATAIRTEQSACEHFVLPENPIQVFA